MTHKGFTLLIAMIFVGVILAFAATIGALGYKQSILAGNAIQSQYAFYAADTGLECALYADQQQAPSPVSFADYPTAPATNQVTCQGLSTTLSTVSYTASGPTAEWVSFARVSLDSGTHCADLTFYEPAAGSGQSTYLFSQGYNASCAAVAAGTARLVARGLENVH